MDVILLERVEKLGQMGDVVKVKDGYARNFLLPQKKALRATEDNRARFEVQRADLEARNLKERKEAEGVASKLDGMTFVAIRQAGDSGQLYGSVTTRDVADLLIENGFNTDRRQVLLDQQIKTLGMHPVRIALHPEVTVTVTMNVARSDSEAEKQARGIRITAEGEEEEAVEAAPEATEVFESEELVEEFEHDVDTTSDEAPTQAQAEEETKSG